MAKRINADKPHLWKSDIAASVDQFNAWFMTFAPEAFRATRVKTTDHVKRALIATRDPRGIDFDTLKENPSAIATLRMCTAPPLAVDRLIGLSGVRKSVVARMEAGKLPSRLGGDLERDLERICHIFTKLLDREIFPWLYSAVSPSEHERDRASTVVADRLCSAVANPIIRNAQEQRQLKMISEWLDLRGYRKQSHPTGVPIAKIEAATYSIRMNLAVGSSLKVNIPIDMVVQPKTSRRNRSPILIEAKSAGDFTNTNKRRKEEATKIHQLKAAYGDKVVFVLFLCGYFRSDYLGYEAAEGIDWV